MTAAEGISTRATLQGLHTPKNAATVRGAADARLRDMAKELEATFLSLLMKEMRQTLDQDGGGLFPGDSGDVQGGLFDMYMGRHLADAGGVGMAAALIRQVQAAEAAVKPVNSAHDAQSPTVDTNPAQLPRQ
jgi:flagellar protein FlgJ